MSEQTQSRHNKMYWEGDREFLSFGMGAASYLDGVRVSRPATLRKYQKYVEHILKGGKPSSALGCSIDRDTL